MPLVDTRPPPSPLNVRPVFTALASLAAVAVFIVGLAVSAWLTADDSTLYVPRHRPPAGGTLGSTGDVGADGGPTSGDAAGGDASGSGGTGGTGGDGGTSAPNDVVVTVERPPTTDDVDAGPALVSAPPFAPPAVIAAAVVLVEACAADALRWDPSLGGPFALIVDLEPLFSARDGAAPPRVTTPGLVSPVLAGCLARRAADVALPPLGDIEVPLAVQARALLDAGGRIAWSDVVVTTSPTATDPRAARDDNGSERGENAERANDHE
jgi:hypothetical protein